MWGGGAGGLRGQEGRQDAEEEHQPGDERAQHPEARPDLEREEDADVEKKRRSRREEAGDEGTRGRVPGREATRGGGADRKEHPPEPRAALVQLDDVVEIPDVPTR